MRKRFVLAAGIAVLFSLRAWAGAEARYFANPDPEKTPIDLFSFQGGYVFQSELHTGSVEFGRQYAYETETEYSHRFLIKGNWYFHVGVNYNRFDFGETSGPVPDHLQNVGALLSIEYCMQGERGLFLEIRPGFFGVDNFDSSSFDMPITLGRAWVLKKDKIFLFTGLNVSFLRGEFPVIPLIGLVYHIDDHWLLYGVPPEPRVVYMPNKKLDIWVGGQITGGSFRTEESNTIFPAKLSHAVVDYSDYRAGAGIVWHASDAIDLDIGAGYSIQRRFNYQRAGQSYKTDPAPYARVILKAEF
ncbi:MAG: hypothetical protein ACXWAV_00815 [Chthoniobacterales bacterium]